MAHGFTYKSIRLTMEKLESEDNLKVFLEPADWDEELHASGSVIQLDVSTKSYIDEMAVSGPSAIERSNLPCMCHHSQIFNTTPTNHMCDAGTMLWSISKPAFDPLVNRGNLAAVHKRACFPLYLPAGVNMRDMEKVWHELQFNPAAPVDVPFKIEMFRPAPNGVEALRELARKGQSYLDRVAREQGGRDKFVLGLPNDAREMAPLLARAHGDSARGSLLAPSVGKGGSRPVGSTANLPTEPRSFEDTEEPITSATDQEQEWVRRDAVSPMMASRQANQLFRNVPLPETNAGSSGSESTVAHLEEILPEDQRKIVGDSAGGQITAVRPSPAHHIHSRSGPTGWDNKSLQLIKDMKRSLRDTDKIG